MAPRLPTTDPVDLNRVQTAPTVVLSGMYTDPKTGAVYVHQDLVKTVEPWAVEQHISPTNRTEHFGSVEAWAAYVSEYATPDGAHLLTWSESGVRAILDYIGPNGEPGRCTWQAVHLFEQTVQWKRWTALANGGQRGQQELLEALEDNAEDIVTPPAGEIAKMLRTMRGTVSATAESTLNEDGSYDVKWAKSSQVKVGGELTFPNEIKIEIPVFKGHAELADVKDENGEVVTNEDGTPKQRLAPVRFRLKVRIRVSPDSSGHLVFRLSMPDREAALEKALENRVEAAYAALGDGYDVLRAAS